MQNSCQTDFSSSETVSIEFPSFAYCCLTQQGGGRSEITVGYCGQSNISWQAGSHGLVARAMPRVHESVPERSFSHVFMTSLWGVSLAHYGSAGLVGHVRSARCPVAIPLQQPTFPPCRQPGVGNPQWAILHLSENLPPPLHWKHRGHRTRSCLEHCFSLLFSAPIPPCVGVKSFSRWNNMHGEN